MKHMSEFVHLHCHSEYSLLEGAMRLDPLLDHCLALGMDTLAITDNGTMFGAIDFYLKAKSKGLKPIIGCEVFLTSDISIKQRARDRLILLCKNYQGYQSLIKIVTHANIDGFYYKPRVDLSLLSQYPDGIIAISPGYSGPIAQRIQKYQDQEAEQFTSQLKGIYSEQFYIGLQKLGLSFEELIIDQSKKLANQFQIPLLATNDVYYLEKKSSYLRPILNCIQTGRKLEGNTALSMQTQEQYLKSPQEMAQVFSDLPECLENTVSLASQCQIDIETEQVLLPRFSCPNNKNSGDYLEELVEKGIQEKYDVCTPEIKKRVAFELGIIKKMHYENYFLIIYDFLAFCVREAIPVGPGRGSAAGSIVAYALNITKIDPIRYNLLFERFLNPERISMPDVDIDFCIRRRGEVIQYIVDTYTKECVSQIITFGTMQSRAVVRDVGRALDVSLQEVDRMAKLIPSGPGVVCSIPQALDESPDLKKMYDQSEEHKQLLDIAIQLEGQCRHTSTHAAGVVISRDPLNTVVPLLVNDGQVATQYPMADIEKIGLLKMDILGLRNLTVMNDAVALIKNRHGVDIDLDHLDKTNQATYELLSSGKTMGVFQLESQGMRTLIKDIKPKVFEDIIAILALYRPGPLGSGMVSEFISNKSGKTQVKYELPELEPILKDTYGMIVYQEQVMQIASVIGGFSLGEADVLRRAMGKKKKAEMDRMKDLFLEGAKKAHFPIKKAQSIFDLCYKFAEYGFNKSHSAAYALISYQTAYLKANFAVEYMTALLSSVSGSSDKTSLYIQDLIDMGIPVLGPSIDSSMEDFSIQTNPDAPDKHAIRFGLRAIKNVGEGAIESIIQNRGKTPYESVWDFCMKVDLRQVNKKVIESLIKSGAMDTLGERSYLLSIFEKTMERAQVVTKERKSGQVALFSDDSVGLTGEKAEEENTDYIVFSQREQLKMEKELLGLYISGHPLDSIKEKLNKIGRAHV